MTLVHSRSVPSRHPSLFCATLGALISTQAQAAPHPGQDNVNREGSARISTPEPTASIIGGQNSSQCQFPSTVALERGCSGTLLHPKLVITAAHCIRGQGPKNITFGEHWSQSKLEAPVERCAVHKDWKGGSGFGKGVDFGYCLLREEVTTVPIVPMLMGCEVDVLQPGTPVVLAGFGADKAPGGKAQGGGPKRFVETEFVKFIDGINKQAIVGRKNAQGCMGDSGGPVFVKLPEDKFNKDAGWRVFGVTSGEYEGPGDCTGGMGQYGMMHLWVEELEKETGLDLTPCFDADGTWNPGPDCQKAPLDLVDGATGSWPSCEPGPVGGLITSCGAQEGAGGDEDDDGSNDDDASKSESDDDSKDDESSKSESDDDSKDDESSKSESDEDSSKDDDSNEDDSSKSESDDASSDDSSKDSKDDSADSSKGSNASEDSGQGSVGCSTSASSGTRFGAWLMLGLPGLLAWRRRQHRR